MIRVKIKTKHQKLRVYLNGEWWHNQYITVNTGDNRIQGLLDDFWKKITRDDNVQSFELRDEEGNIIYQPNY